MEMRFKTKFMKDLVSKAITKAVKKRAGVDLFLLLQGMDITVDGDNAIAKVSFTAGLPKSDLEKIIQNFL